MFCFELVVGVVVNDLLGVVFEVVKEECYVWLMEKIEVISVVKFVVKVGCVLLVIIDEVGEFDEDGDLGVIVCS